MWFWFWCCDYDLMWFDAISCSESCSPQFAHIRNSPEGTSVFFSRASLSLFCCNSAVPTAFLSDFLYQLLLHLLCCKICSKHPPGMRADTQRIEIKIWSSGKASILRFSRGAVGWTTLAVALNSPFKECPVWLQIRHRGRRRPLPCYTFLIEGH